MWQSLIPPLCNELLHLNVLLYLVVSPTRKCGAVPWKLLRHAKEGRFVLTQSDSVLHGCSNRQRFVGAVEEIY